MKNRLSLTLIIVLLISGQAFSQRFPFPQHTPYHKHIKPSQFTQQQLDDKVRALYDAWKDKYLINGCESNHYYVFFDSGNTVTVSEAMGYGMMIVPLMAGYDADAKKYFDGLFRYFKAHRSHIMPNLMAWKQITGCVNSDGPDSASDGDIDIAFGLLLAHAQWGSEGAINYYKEALLVINDIMGKTAAEGDINQNFYSVKLGDWVQSGSYMKGTRTSDFIMDHFRAFACAAKDTNWNSVIDKCYTLIDDMQTNYSPETGLLPDFIVDVDGDAKPAPANYLEGEKDGAYYYNACRDPWRLTTDYLISGDERAKDAVLKINRWLLQKTDGKPNKVKAGYYLDGTKASGWTDNSFTAPFTVGAMVDTANQQWLNKLFTKILQANTASGSYYDNTLRLLSAITISGNYWVPSCDILISGINNPKGFTKPDFKIYPTSSTGKFTIEFPSSFNHQGLILTVTSAQGRQLNQIALHSNIKSEIDLKELPSGLYLISVVANNNEWLGVRKVIKE